MRKLNTNYCLTTLKFISRLSHVNLKLIFISATLTIFIGVGNVYSQANVYWRGDGPASGNWQQGVNPCGENETSTDYPWYYNGWNPNNARGRADCFDDNLGHIIHFNNDYQTNMTLNESWFRAHQILFENDAPRTINGGNGIDMHRSGSKIENNSNSTHTFNVQIALQFNPVQINPVSGDLVFTNSIYTNGNYIDIYGDNRNTLTITGDITGTGGIAMKQNSLVIFQNDKTYTNSTAVEAGTLELQGSIASSAVTVKSGATLKINGDAVTVASLTVESGGNVEIVAGKSLTVSGNLSNSGTFTIKSNAAGTGSLIVNGTATGDVLVKRYLTNYDNAADAKYHFISSPVTSQKIQDVISGETVTDENFVTDPPSADVDFYKFDEEINTWINSKEGTSPDFTWVNAFGANFEVGKGYLVAYPDAPVTKEFSGTLNNEESYPLDCTHTDGKGNGWNLLGNPYPAAIDWTAVTLGNGMDDALYYYDAGAGKYRYYIKLQGESEALGDGQQYIPSGQGFMVHAKSTGTKTVTIKKADLTHNGQNVFYKSTTNLVSGSLSLKVTGNGHEDQTFIHFNENASGDFDGSYDAYKLMSANPIIPMLYTTNESGVDFAINGLPRIEEGTTVPVALKIGEAGEYTIQAMINGVETNLFLEDLFTGESTKLNDNPIYSFTSSSTDSPDRFLLHFGVVGIGEQDQATTLNAYAYNNRLYVNNSLEQAQIAVYDLQGRLLMQQSANISGLQSLPLDLPAGVYVVRLSNAQEAKSVKINVQ